MRLSIVSFLAVMLSGCGAERVLGPSPVTTAERRIRIRGTFDDSKAQPVPILIIDGHVIVTDSAAVNAYLGKLRPNAIESVEILKGEAAEAVYATGGCRAIIRIRTRHASRNAEPRS